MVHIIRILYIFIFLIFLSCDSNKDDTIIEKYHFDDHGRTTAYISPTGQKINFFYDKKGNLQKIKSPERSTEYGYDKSGNRIWMQDKTGITEYFYDASDRLIAILSKHSPTYLMEYDYDHWDNITEIGILDDKYLYQYNEYDDLTQRFNENFQLTLEKHQERQQKLEALLQRIDEKNEALQQKLYEYQVKYQYDALNRLIEVDYNGKKTHYTYDIAQRQIIRQLPNNIYTTFRFTPDGTLKSIRHEKPQGKLLQEYKYDYDFAGRIIKVTENEAGSSKITRFVWNDRNLLSEVQLPNNDHITYDYNSLGQLTMGHTPTGDIPYKYDSFNRLIQRGDIHYHWNNNNIIGITGTDINTKFGYDSWGNLVKIKTPESSIEFNYDGNRNLISITKNQTEIIHTIPDPLMLRGSILAEFDDSGQLKNSYLYGNNLLGQFNSEQGTGYFLEGALGRFGQFVNQAGKTVKNFGSALSSEKGLNFINQNLSTNILFGYYFPKYFSKYFGKNLSQNIGRGLGLTFSLVPTAVKQYVRLRHSQGHGPIITEEEFQGYAGATASFLMVIYAEGALGLTGAIVPIVAGVSLGIAANHIVEYVRRFGTFLGDRSLSFSLGHGFMSSQDFIKQRRNQDLKRRLTETQLQGNKNSKSLYPILNLNIKFKKSLPDFEDHDRFKYRVDQYYILHGHDHGPCPPFCFDRGGGAKEKNLGEISPISQAITNSLKDPITAVEQQLGGIELASAAEFHGSLGKITAAVYDPKHQYLVLIGDQNYSGPSIKAEDFSVALALTFGTPEQDAKFSLDPADPKNPNGKWLKTVYIPENILAGTYFGQALFDADWQLKQYSMGVYIDKDGHLQPRKSNVKGYKHVATLSLERKDEGNSKELWARYWIVNDSMVLKKRNNSIVYDKAKMAVKAKRQVVDPTSETGLRDVPTGPNEIPTIYAKLLTKLYDDLAKEEPSFERVRELAKVVALAKWLKKQNIPVNMEWIFQYVNHRIKYVTKAPTLSYQWKKENKKTYQKGNKIITETSIHSVHLFGGVDLSVHPIYKEDDGQVAAIKKVVLQHLENKVERPVFKIIANNRPLVASVVPFVGKGNELWKSQSSEIANKPKPNYRFNKQGKIIKKIEPNGDQTKYEYGENGHLSGIHTDYTNGAKLIYKKDHLGSNWTYVKPNGKTIEYDYDSQGYLIGIKTDGKVMAAYSYDFNNFTVKANYLKSSEILTYDKSKRSWKYKVLKYSPSLNKFISSEFEYRYNNKDLLKHISGDGLQPIDIFYDTKGKKITKIKTPDLTTEFFYNSNGRIIKIKRSDRTLIRYIYGQNKEVSVQIEKEGKKMEYVWDANGPKRFINILGEIIDFNYEEGKLISVKSNEFGSMKFKYDKNNNLEQVELPDHRSIKYQYVLRNITKKDGNKKFKISEMSIHEYPILK